MSLSQQARMVRDVAKQTFQEWKDDDGPQWGAALAYYAVFSLAPMLVIALVIGGVLFDEATVRAAVVRELRNVLGTDGAAFVDSLVGNAMRSKGGGLALFAGIVGLLIGATGAFAQLNKALNRMWGIRAVPKRAWLRVIKKRSIAFLFVLLTGFLLLLTLVATAALSTLDRWADGLFPGASLLVAVLGIAVSIGVFTLLFALIFRYLPDAQIAWREVWLGAFLTAVVLEAGKWAVGYYLRHAGAASSYGAAGALVLILIGVWFASQIVFLGAEFTQVHARRRGEPIIPEAHAVRVARAV